MNMHTTPKRSRDPLDILAQSYMDERNREVARWRLVQEARSARAAQSGQPAPSRRHQARAFWTAVLGAIASAIAWVRPAPAPPAPLDR